MEKDSTSVKALKSGVWYTVSNFLIKGIAFLTTPVFSRLLSKGDYGAYSNFTSWLSVLSILCTLHLVSAAARARYDFTEDYDEYLSSVVALGSVVSLACSAVFMIFGAFFSGLFEIDARFLPVLSLVLIFSPALDMLQVKQRYEFRYRSFVAVSIFNALVSTLTAVFLVRTWEDRLAGRIYGTYLPSILIYIAAFTLIMLRGKKLYRPNCWKYALAFSLPIIPHLLSNVILGISDKIMITKMVGPEANAVYSIAYSCGMIVATLLTSLNQAMVPWLFEKLHSKEYEFIKKVTRLYILFLAAALECLILLSPELIMFLGGKNYAGSEYLVPPVMLGYGFKFAYTIYVNVEQYEKRTGIVSVGTLIAAAVNVALNLLLIPVFGFVTAAYTTLAGFALLLVIHYIASARLGFVYMYDNFFTFAVMGIMTVLGLMGQLLFPLPVVRYALVVLIAAAGAAMLIRLRRIYGKKGTGKKEEDKVREEGPKV
ncbi:MAG: flippase [Lachnospiraceae bacterium]|nr:flippase [Lachnospiraceae bacterium]